MTSVVTMISWFLLLYVFLIVVLFITNCAFRVMNISEVIYFRLSHPEDNIQYRVDGTPTSYLPLYKFTFSLSYYSRSYTVLTLQCQVMVGRCSGRGIPTDRSECECKTQPSPWSDLMKRQKTR